ncbi:MAG: Na+/H+ antiporter NhaA [Alphaproteobacteria bacterium]|nr:Na+/H+ antiporter NhaA [Alphaproteobacteria bacterium]
MILSLTRDIQRTESRAGLLMMTGAILALLVANSPLYPFYQYVFEHIDFRIGFSDAQESFRTEINKSLLHWINDGLMALFFFLVGLEIKREALAGYFSKKEGLILPVIAAIAGICVPALVFWFLNRDTPENMSGWAVPTATDIVFALAVLSLLGKRISPHLKILLLTIAVVDDIGAILIIAFFYSHDIHIGPLYIAAATLFFLAVLNRRGVTSVGPYVLLGFLLWVCVLESGIHATIAGVLAALFIPLHGKGQDSNNGYSPLKHLEHDLYPAVFFAIIPLFAFANSGISLANMTLDHLFHPVTGGIVLGLFFGKQIGIFLALWLVIKTGCCPKPPGSNWLQLYGLSILCGTGFTMSLFIGALSYTDPAMQTAVRVGVLLGSLLSAVVGYLVLLWSVRRKGPRPRIEKAPETHETEQEAR